MDFPIIPPGRCTGALLRNAIVFKPAGLVPGCAWTLVDILKKAGLPDGVLDLVMGGGGTVGETILSSRKINAVTFTGLLQPAPM